jgi:hypothetical protein
MHSRSGFTVGAAVVAVVVVLLGVIIWASNSFTSTDPGYVGLPRNGGPFDNTHLQTDADGNPVVVPQGSGLTNIGFASTLRQYPTNGRWWTIDPDGGDTNQAVDVPTKDGVNVGVTGQFNFQQNLDPKVLAEFDEKFGSRTFTDPSGNAVKVSDGTDAGYNAFLSAFLSNTVNNALRTEMSGVLCKDVISSCALVQNGATSVDLNANNQGTITAIQNAVNANFERALNAQLGGPYLTNVTFNLAKVSLPGDLQAAVGRAQAAFAQVSEAQARVQSAMADAQATQAKSQAYQNCPGCLQLDLQKAQGDALAKLQPGAIFAPGGQGLNLNVPAAR